MKEPWNLKKDDIRQSDSLPTFIVFCEDEVSEPIYLKYFETSFIKINPIKAQKSKIDNVFKAICFCKEKGLIDSTNEGIFKKDETIHIWCVFDRDKESDVSKVHLGDTSFDESIKTAISNGLKVAWSNDSFELWILLHFEDIEIKDENLKTRDKYYERLTEIFKTLSNPNEDLLKALRHESFNYKRDLKRENNFRNIVRPEIIGKTYNAIARAKKLEEHFATLNLCDHSKSPCTLMHHLIEELIRYGKKKI